MDEQLEFIIDRVSRHDQDRQLYIEMANHWVEMWKLNAGFDKPLKESIKLGHEQVILPTPFNTVNLSQRLLSTTPRIDVIPEDIANRESEENAQSCEKWLTAMWKQVNRQQQRNVLGDNISNSLIYGRHVFDVRWIRDQLPPLLRKSAFPFAIRALRPTDVGIHQGPYATEFAYHKYDAPVLEVVRRWPELKHTKRDSKLGGVLENVRTNNNKTEDQLVCVTDYWAMDEDDGSIFNTVLVEDEYAKPFKVTSYPFIPIIGGRGDYAVGIGDEYDGLSILHGIDGIWQYRCRLASQLATGLMWYFWPHFLIENENNTPFEDFELLPGGQNPVPAGTKVQQVTMNPNVPLAEAVTAQLDTAMQQATYPDMLYGMAPTDLKSGYSVALLSDAASGRVKNFQESLQMSIERVNELVLALIEKKGGAKGVDIWGVTEHNEKYRLNLSKKQINGVYNNEVHITPAMPTDDLQKTSQGKLLADSKYISSQQLRDRYLGIKSPTDETRRIALEEAMQSDEMRPYRIRKAMEDYFGEEAYTIIWEAGEQAQQAFLPPLEEGYEWDREGNGKVVMKRVPPPPPQLPGPPGGGMGGPPPDMGGMGGPPPGPPMGEPPPPDMGGMPPDMGGMPPDMGGMPPDMGMPPQGPSLQPPGMGTPLGGGLPPALMGQMEGENLGLPNDVDPLLMDMIMNTPGSPEEQMNLAAGLPEEGPLY